MLAFGQAMLSILDSLSVKRKKFQKFTSDVKCYNFLLQMLRSKTKLFVSGNAT
jgi:hypothetical protein